MEETSFEFHFTLFLTSVLWALKSHDLKEASCHCGSAVYSISLHATRQKKAITLKISRGLCCWRVCRSEPCWMEPKRREVLDCFVVC